MKRLFDLIVTLVAIGLLWPLMLLLAILIRFKLGSPVLFRQIRPGLHGRAFTIYKFRSMTDKRDASGVLLPDDVRMTALGHILRRYSLDELPQLLNVLRGDLSLVGPRPLLMEYLPLYSPDQARRHEVRPGITGWAQVNGRNAITWAEKFELDVWYVDHQSFWLDIKILWMTLKKVLAGSGVSQTGCVTADKFIGNS